MSNLPPNPPVPPNPSPRPSKEPADYRPSKSDAVLRRTLVRPVGITPDPVDSAYVSNRLTALTHELANLLDGSLRLMTVARRSLPDDGQGKTSTTLAPGQISRHLETVYAAMLQMADLVRNSMAGMPPAPGGTEGMKHALGASGTVEAAVRHAVDVMWPLAEERHIDLRSDIGAELCDVPAGPIYSVVTNTVRNAIESIERSGHGFGSVTVRAWMEAGRTGRCVGIEICDDGQGPPITGAKKIFEYGVSVKDGGPGIGLAHCRELVEQLGGTIELSKRPDERQGAVLCVRYPVPAMFVERAVG